MNTQNRLTKLSPQSMARLAGVLYLIIIVLGIWSDAVVRMGLTVPGAAASTAANILASQGLFRASLAADSIMALADVGLAVLLFILLKPVSHTLALGAMVFRLTQTAILGMNLLNQHSALMFLNGAGSMVGFDAEQLNTLALFFLQAHGFGYDLGLIFFGINSLLVGFLVFKSDFFPRAIGVLMGGAGVVYLTGSYLVFLAPAHAEVFAPAYVIPVVAEVSFALWLLVKGVNKEKWAINAQAPQVQGA